MKRIINTIKMTMGGIIWAATAGSAIMYVASVVWPVALVAAVTVLYLMAIGGVE